MEPGVGQNFFFFNSQMDGGFFFFFFLFFFFPAFGNKVFFFFFFFFLLLRLVISFFFLAASLPGDFFFQNFHAPLRISNGAPLKTWKTKARQKCCMAVNLHQLCLIHCVYNVTFTLLSSFLVFVLNNVSGKKCFLNMKWMN